MHSQNSVPFPLMVHRPVKVHSKKLNDFPFKYFLPETHKLQISWSRRQKKEGGYYHNLTRKFIATSYNNCILASKLELQNLAHKNAVYFSKIYDL